MNFFNSNPTIWTRKDRANAHILVNDFKSVGGRLFFFPTLGLTVALVPAFSGSDFASMGVAWCSLCEAKFSHLIGSVHAITRCYQPVPCDQENFENFAISFSKLFEPIAQPETELLDPKAWPFPT